MDVASLFLNLKVNSSGIGKDINKSASLAEKIAGKAFSKIGATIAGALSVAAIASFSKSCLELGSDLAEVQNVVDVTFPTMNKQVNEFAKNAISQFGLSETVAKRMTGTYGAMAQAFGFSEQEAYKMSTRLTGLAGDVSSFYNLDPSESYTKLKSVFTGETESLKDLGVVMSQNALDQFALAKGYNKTTSSMSEQEKVALRMMFVTEQLSAANGDFSNTSDSWANKVRVLSLNFDSLKATIGQGLINILSPVVTIINEIVLRLTVLANKFLEFTSLFSKNKNAGNAMSSVASGANAAATKVSDVGKAAKKTAKQLGSLAGFDELNVMSSNNGSSDASSGGATGGGGPAVSMDIDTSGIDKASQSVDTLKGRFNAFKSFILENGPLIVSILAGIAAGFASFKIITGWGAVTTAISAMLGAVEFASLCFSTFFSTLLSGQGLIAALASVFGTATASALVISGVIGAVTGALVYLYNTSDSFKKLVNEAVAGIGSILSNLHNNVLKPIFGLLGSMFNTIIMPLVTFISSVFVKAVESVATIALTFFNSVLKPIANFLVDVLAIALNGVIEIWNHWKVKIDAISKAVSTVWKTYLSPFADFITKTVCKKITDFGNLITVTVLPNVKGAFKGLINFLTGVFTGNWKKAFEGLKSIFKNVMSGLAGLIKKPINDIIKQINGFIDGINKIKVPAWVPGVGGKGINIPRIPALANGGYVKANSPQLAMIGDNRTQGEIVSPEGKMFEIMMKALESYGRQNNDNANIQVLVSVMYEILEAIKQLRLVVDGDALANDSRKRNEQYRLRTG